MICILLLLICGGCLTIYLVEYISAEKDSQTLREAYYSIDVARPTSWPGPSSAPSEPAAPSVSQAASLPMESEAVPTIAVLLPRKPYPQNPSAVISKRFERVRRQNADIIGWLTIDSLIDEAVVQRDNTYYLRRDYQGYHNQNGALFLDQYCDLSTRPYTLIIYGHNMKTGVRFGSLRNYEDIGFYRRNALFTFDTAYEDGRYVIFSVGSFSTDSASGKYLNLGELTSPTIELRKKALLQLEKLSIYDTYVNVNAEDQIVLLVTCEADGDVRRFVAARRITPNEREKDIAELVADALRK